MQCRAAIPGQHCARCQNAQVHCNYSEPGRPGRPVTKEGNGTGDTGTANAKVVRAVIPPPNWNAVDEVTWLQNTFPTYIADEGSSFEYTMGDQSGPSTPHGFLNGSAGGLCLQLDQMEFVSPLDWSLCTSETGVFGPKMSGDILHIDQSGLDDIDLTANPDPTRPSSTSDTNALRSASRDFIERLAYLQVDITRRLSFGSYTGLSKLGKEAAHVLESSSKLLELIQQVMEAPAHTPPQQSVPFDRAVFLQLTSMSMGLTDMHIWLYTSIHRYVQQQDVEVIRQTNKAGEAANTHPNHLLFSIAGVTLEPSPYFWLRIVLETGIHFLGRVQESLDALEIFAFDVESGGSPTCAVQTHMLIVEDRRDRMARIQLVLDKLNEKFGMSVSM
ncbi:hypothetical protein JX266_011253 [Neoarthrinium moseri]|nr:hypothetical protein JX266_011253 [Neoarthrinium moseri]